MSDYYDEPDEEREFREFQETIENDGDVTDGNGNVYKHYETEDEYQSRNGRDWCDRNMTDEEYWEEQRLNSD